jgi:hypothetical protein
MALEPGSEEAEAEERRLSEEDELLFQDIAREMARLGLGDCPEAEAEEGPQEEDAAAEVPAHGFPPLPVLLQRRPSGHHLYLYGPPPLLPPRMLPPPPPFTPPAHAMPGGDRKFLEGWRFVVGRGHAPALQGFRGGGSGPPRAAWPPRAALPGDAAAAWPGRAGAAEACVQYLCTNQQQVLNTLFRGRSEAADACAQLIVRNAVPLIETVQGARLLGLVLESCADGLQCLIVARITRDHKKFFRICADRHVPYAHHHVNFSAAASVLLGPFAKAVTAKVCLMSFQVR